MIKAGSMTDRFLLLEPQNLLRRHGERPNSPFISVTCFPERRKLQKARKEGEFIHPLFRPAVLGNSDIYQPAEQE
jgi:hypothetical protein